MERPRGAERNRGLTAVNGALGLIVVLVVVQMWLLTASLEAFLGGHREVALPAAAVSALLFSACGALFLFVRRVDERTGREDAAEPRSIPDPIDPLDAEHDAARSAPR